MQTTTLVILGSVPFLLGGILCVGLGLRALLLARASRRWQRTQGKVVNTWISTHADPSGQTPQGAIPHVEYEYQVGDRTFRSRRIRFGAQAIDSGRVAARIVESYPVGAAVTVFYDPEKPSRCTLEQGVWSFFVVTFLLLGIFLAAGSIYAMATSDRAQLQEVETPQ